ncbi:MAG TPA: ATP-binding protein [Casimicrobiaceae bacterium]|nr:ATP-binding protein [Casimicrobiaceae bacterium]
MKLWPRSLFGRLALLLVGVLALAIAATTIVFHQDRAALLLRQFGETKIVQLQGLRAALEDVTPDNRREALTHLAERQRVRILPADEREPAGLTSSGWRGQRGQRPATSGPLGYGAPAPRGGARDRDGDGTPDAPSSAFTAFVAALAQLEARFAEALGPGIEMRVQPRSQLLWVRLPTVTGVYWIGFTLPPRPGSDSEPTRALVISLTLALALIVAAFVFARYLVRPLRELEGAVARVGRGENVAPLPETGPSEIASVHRGFNTMLADLRQTEHDRALLLAGVSHDLRTPLARLRLGIELANADPMTRQGMVADIEEMDRIIGQFLDFARGDDAAAVNTENLDALAGAVVARYAINGREVRFDAGSPSPRKLRPTAIKRLIANLIDNALAYGAPPIEVCTRERGGVATIEVADRGAGIAPDDVERLKQPFTRASDSRAREDGAPGAGLGLAIVERIARLHGGRFDLLPREGGGTLARVTLPSLPSLPSQGATPA